VDFVQKFAAAGADVGVLDLEDATPEAGKAEARETLRSAVPGAPASTSSTSAPRTSSPTSAGVARRRTPRYSTPRPMGGALSPSKARWSTRRSSSGRGRCSPRWTAKT